MPGPLDSAAVNDSAAVPCAPGVSRLPAKSLAVGTAVEASSRLELKTETRAQTAGPPAVSTIPPLSHEVPAKAPPHDAARYSRPPRLAGSVISPVYAYT